MYPLRTIMISPDDELLPEIRRELLNAGVEDDGCYPDVPTAIEQVRLNHDEMRLFVVHLESIDDLRPLKHLSGVFVGRPILAVVDGSPSASAVVHAMREGATQVVLNPFQPDDFLDALQSIRTQYGHALNRSRLIGITGSHGGVGATTISVNLAYEIAQTFQVDCVLVEMSAHIGQLASYLNIEPKHSTRDLLEMGDEIDVHTVQNALVPFGERLSVLAGPVHAARDVYPSRYARQTLIECARQLADIVILDVPSTLDSEQFETLDAVDVTVLVGEQTVPSIQMTCESLRLGIRAHSPVVVINRFDDKLDVFDAARLSDVLGTDHVRTISDDRAAVNASINRGHPLRLTAPHSRALADIVAIAEDLLGKHHKTHRRPGLLRGLVHALESAMCVESTK